MSKPVRALVSFLVFCVSTGSTFLLLSRCSPEETGIVDDFSEE